MAARLYIQIQDLSLDVLPLLFSWYFCAKIIDKLSTLTEMAVAN